ncbi:glycosyltransferase [Aliikangiella marina]|uniref:Glycosyltransferase n=1 Tax=Aliikangiella marina TaxID=1712262 RepID=A0A545T9A2_9GAMM|nr:glycosyltransferase family 2 protein [Aliikangiella marina]TQV73793.1 glycosyltransferase [Aliikangiella marina]
MVKVSVVMPVYNVERYVEEAIQSVIHQSFTDFELIIVNDGSTDNSLSLCKRFNDSRIRVVTQRNRGLAGARNTGVRESSGEYVAFIDSDDKWHQDKLKHHVNHLNNNPIIGVSYSASALMDERSQLIGITQKPKLSNISIKDIICRNPIGNGSAPVIRRSVLDQSSYWVYRQGAKERCFFDETFRQSEDVEYWLRIALQSATVFSGIGKSLTFYRVNSNGLSANVSKQYLSWERAINKAWSISPKKVSPWVDLAKAYQLRYLARHAVKSHDAKLALKFIIEGIRTQPRILAEEPIKTSVTFAAALLLNCVPKRLFSQIESTLFNLYRRTTARVA